MGNGSNKNVQINLTSPVALPARVFVLVHREDNGNATFDFPKGDAPAQIGSGVVVVPVDLVAK